MATNEQTTSEHTAKKRSGSRQTNQTNQSQSDSKQQKSQDQKRNGRNRRRSNKNVKRTSTFKHVELQRERPQLSRDGAASAGAKDASKQKRNRSRKGGKGRDPKATLEVIPLGGLDAIGMNMTVFECGNDMILDDAGIMFPDDDHPGVDLILPDYTYVLENVDKLRGIVVTHGHEDHVGSLPYLMKDLGRNVPIYATKLTLGLIEGKFKEHRIKNAKLIEIKSGDSIKLGRFDVEFFSVNHSIPGAVGVFIQSPAGNVLHTGDFKLDQTPIDGVHTDFAAIARFSDIGVDLMMSDSTNAMNPNFTKSEAEVGKVLADIIGRAKGRVIIASFASHIHRMQQICDAAVANGRKVVVTGRSMIQNTDIARRLGYLNIADSDLIDAYELKGIPPEEVVIMCTGSQGEPLSALARIANGEHKTIDIEEGDTVIISATPVPGNEKAVTRVVNSLAKIGADVYDKSKAQVHVSGHAGSEELKIMLTMVKPNAFMPVHGEASHLRAHAKLAEATGVDPNNIFVMENGDSLIVSADGYELGEGVQSGVVYVDGLSVGDTSQDVLDERNALGSQGFASIAIALSFSKRKIVGRPQVEMHGITGGDDSHLIRDATASVENAVKPVIGKGSVSMRDVRKTARDTLLSLLWARTKQRPMVVVNLLEV